MKKIILYLILVVTLITGCDNELDITNPNQAAVDAYWTTSNEALRGVNAVYSTLHRGGISRWLPFYYIVRSDEGRSVSPATDIVNNMDIFQVTDYNYGNAYAIWNDNYIGINRANQVIDNVPAIDMDETLRNRYVGEAKFLRALFYYHLVTLWGNVPLMLKTSVVTDRPATTLNSYLEVWAQIEIDLNEAADVLPAEYPNDGDIGRATKGAAYALLAKAYMQQGKYADALTPLQWLVEGEGASVYDLTTDYRDNFLITTENNIESVFEWQFAVNTTEYTDDDSETPNQNYGTSISQFFSPVGWSDGEANRWLISEFDELTIGGDRDPRLAASLLFDSTDVNGPNSTIIYGQTFEQRYPEGNNYRNRVWFRKFLNDHWKNEEGYRSPNNWRYIRYADVLLMYAEALNAEGQTAAAYEHVNRVRNRAGLPDLADTGMDQDEFLEQIKHERITELSGEGHRWNDLARWGDLGTGIANRDNGFANFDVGRDELLPIPQTDRDINPNLVQNPNW